MAECEASNYSTPCVVMAFTSTKDSKETSKNPCLFLLLLPLVHSCYFSVSRPWTPFVANIIARNQTAIIIGSFDQIGDEVFLDRKNGRYGSDSSRPWVVRRRLTSAMTHLPAMSRTDSQSILLSQVFYLCPAKLRTQTRVSQRAFSTRPRINCSVKCHYGAASIVESAICTL